MNNIYVKEQEKSEKLAHDIETSTKIYSKLLEENKNAEEKAIMLREQKAVLDKEVK